MTDKQCDSVTNIFLDLPPSHLCLHPRLLESERSGPVNILSLSMNLNPIRITDAACSETKDTQHHSAKVDVVFLERANHLLSFMGWPKDYTAESVR